MCKTLKMHVIHLPGFRIEAAAIACITRAEGKGGGAGGKTSQLASSVFSGGGGSAGSFTAVKSSKLTFFSHLSTGRSRTSNGSRCVLVSPCLLTSSAWQPSCLHFISVLRRTTFSISTRSTCGCPCIVSTDAIFKFSPLTSLPLTGRCPGCDALRATGGGTGAFVRGVAMLE